MKLIEKSGDKTFSSTAICIYTGQIDGFIVLCL